MLADALEPLGEITVMAPDRNRSGASNSLTLESPLRVIRTGERRYCVNGTPSDCVHLGVSGFLPEEPDMVVSGINEGANLGDDVIYSGTVAAAMEGRFLGLPAIAVSLVGNNPLHYATAARVVVFLLERMQRHPLPSDTILNVNVPDLPWQQIKGIEIARLGFRHRSAPVVQDRDPKDKPIYWIGPAGGGQDAGPGTDFNAIARGRVAVTPLKVDLTRQEALDDMRSWLADD